VPLPREEYKGNAAHWARAHPSVKLQRIPTLYRYPATGSGRKPVGSLVEGQAKDPALVAELLAED
jgi:hypothetical protein